MRTDREKFDTESFVMVDVELARVVFYVYESREPFFLFQTPAGMDATIPWEVSFTKVRSSPNYWQLHFEFSSDAVLPMWYSVQQTCKARRVDIIPLQGNYCFFFRS